MLELENPSVGSFVPPPGSSGPSTVVTISIRTVFPVVTTHLPECFVF
jgi:hypothetical protein